MIRTRRPRLSRLVVTALVALATFAFATPIARATDPSGQITVAATGGVTSGFTANLRPDAITTGPDAHIWFTTDQPGIGRVNSDGTVSLFTSGITGAFLSDITTGADGNLWFVEFNPPSKIAKITTAGVVTEVATVGVTSGLPSSGNIESITSGPDGNLWFTMPYASGTQGAVGKITTGGAVTTYAATYASETQPRYITTGPDGNLWVSDTKGFIVKVAPADGSMTVVATAGTTSGFTANSSPAAITAGSDSNLWFLEDNNGSVARVTPAGVVTEFPLVAQAYLRDITSACDGNLWIAQAEEDHSTSQIWRVTTAGVATSFTSGLPSQSSPYGIATGPDDNVWATGYTDPGYLFRIGTACGSSPTTTTTTTAPAPVVTTPNFTG